MSEQQKTYKGVRPADDQEDGQVMQLSGVQVTVQVEGGRPKPLRHVQLHSDGFEWGYSGSGPADLALSILADHFDERPSRRQLHHGECECWPLHQKFKEAFVAGWPMWGWEITSRAIDDWLNAVVLQDRSHAE